MPTIEIASISSTELGLRQVDFDVAIIEEDKLISHRGLFYDILLEQNGVIIHIGNPDLKIDKEGGFYAGQIIDWSMEPVDIIISEIDPKDPTDNSGANQQFRFKFLKKFKPDIDTLLRIALDKSHIRKICFLTDYQFGPEKASTEIIYTITDFWKQHDDEGLHLNTMYEMYGQ